MTGFGQSRAKAERLVQLASALGRGRPISLHELRESHGLYDGDAETSRRQFERDKSTLRENGVLIETVDQGDISLYWIRSRHRPVRMTNEELDALAVLAAVVGDPMTGVSLAALAGDAGQFPAEHAPGKVSVDNLAIPESVTTALADSLQLDIDYLDADGEESHRTIEPWELRHRNGLTYVVAFDLLRGARRSFRLDRIVGSPVVGGPADHPRPEGPTGPVHPNERFDFVIMSPAELDHHVTELGGTITSTDDGWLTASVEGERPEIMLGWCLRHGAHIVSPDQFATEQRGRLDVLVQRHSVEAADVKVPRAPKARTQNLSVERMRRLMLLPRFLGELKGVTRQELADYLGCTLDELQAELDLLDTVEVPGLGAIGEVEEIGGQLVYHRHLHDPTIQLSPSDALRLLFLVEMVRPILSEEAAGLEAISARLHEMIPAAIQIELAGSHHPDLDDIKQAIREGLTISFEYQGRKDARRRLRYAAPSAFRVAHGAIYVAGTDATIGQVRQFRLDRMGPVTITTAVPAAEDASSDTSASSRPTASKEIDVVLQLGRRATWLLAQLTPSALEQHDDGTATAVVSTDAEDWVLAHVFAAGGEAELIAPPHLRQRVAAIARERLDQA